jgi:NAD(P)H-nitrite reductase large subunit
MPTERYNYVIVGAGAAGLAAADAIRRQDGDGSVLLISGEAHCPYSRVLLADVVTGEKAPSELCLYPAGFYGQRRLSTRLGVAVARVIPGEHEVELEDGARIGYGKLLIATGSRARPLGAAGAGSARVHGFHDLDDAVRLRATARPGERALVYGGGLVSLELVVALRKIGVEVVAVMRGPGYFWRKVTGRGLRLIEERLAAADVAVRADRSVTAVTERVDGRCEARLSDGGVEAADIVLVGTGTVPNVGCLAGSGVDFDEADGVAVDSGMRTGVPDVYAAGDVANFHDVYSDRRRTDGTWQSAMFQGRTAGQNMAGLTAEFSVLAGHAVDCFGLPTLFLGDTQDAAAESVARDYADGASARLFLKDGRLIGLACVGKFPERPAATALVMKRVRLGAGLAALSDATRPLADLVK